MEQYNVLDLFCGCGGMSWGLAKKGFNIVAGFDIWDIALLTYQHITYNHGNGEMLIHLDYFFPCSQVRFKKLLKIIELDWRHEAELKENLKIHFQKRIADLTALWKENSKLYYDNKEKAASTKAIIDNRKHPNGLPLSKDELKEARADFRTFTAAYKQALSDAKSNKRFKERFEKYLESM